VPGDVARLIGEGGVGVGVLVGDPGEQVGLVGQQLGSIGGVAAEGRWALPCQTRQELGDVAGGDGVGGDRGRVGWFGWALRACR
jgi:hypothetical protein